MRILVEINSAMAATRSYAECLWGTTLGEGHTHATLRQWRESWGLTGIDSVPEESDTEEKAVAQPELRAEPAVSSVALTAEHVAALVAAIGRIQLQRVPGNEHIEEFVDGWSTTLTIAYGYSSIAFKWANDPPPSEWLGVAEAMETIQRIRRELT